MSVSALAGKGKVRALKLITGSKEYQDTFLKLGQEWELSQELTDKLEEFTCSLYAPKTLNKMISGITCSVLKKVILKVISYHHARIA